MRTTLSFASPAEIATELLAVLAVDTQTEKGPAAKPAPTLLTSDHAVTAAAAAVLASGEFKAGANETLLLLGLASRRKRRCTTSAMPPERRFASPSRAGFASWLSPCQRTSPKVCRSQRPGRS